MVSILKGYRILVTTSNERTWPNTTDSSVVFLGEWCKRYSRKKNYKKFNAIVAPYHWDDRKKLYTDYQYLQKLYENLLIDLSHKLNQIHSLDQSLHYWRVVVGPWLGFFIQILFDRWFMLKSVIEQSEIGECGVLDRDTLTIVPNDMEHFNKLFVEDDWNEAIYGHLLEACFSDVIKIKKVQNQQSSRQLEEYPNTNRVFKVKSVVKRLIILLERLLPDNNYFFISSYLPLMQDLRLQIRLKQFPRFCRTKQVPIRKPNIKKRQWRLRNNEFDNDSFEVIARQFIPLHIPTSYLEGYAELTNVVNSLPWTKKPKVIFTSNAYLADDVFKVWAAEKVKNGTSLVIGQHGGHFGMTPFSFHEEHQIKIATRWLSWGWSDSSRPHITPVGNLKCFGESVKYNPSGGVLMVEMTNPRFSYHMSAVPVSRQWLDYFEDQKRFISALPQELHKQVLIKLYSNDYGWNQKQRWQDHLPKIRIASGHQGMRKLIEKSRLYISTYNATTYLESLFWNIPTVIFWNTEHWEVKEDVQPYFDLLKEVGVFHKTPESAANQVIDVWHDVSRWWESQPVQEARVQFCEQFSRKPEDMIGELETVFRDLSVDL